MEIRLAENSDLSGWVQLVEPMRHLFPGLETPESMEGYARDIAGAISRQEALCAVENGTICGVLAFSRAENELAFLAVSAQHRRQGIARKLAERMFRELDSARPVKLITYRAGVPEGEAARSLYQRLGFCPGRLVEVDGSPAQEFLRPAGIPGSERSEAE